MISKRDRQIKKVLQTPVTRKHNHPSLLDYSPELRGPANNKHGGHQAQSLRGFRGGTYGPASPVRQYTPEEITKWEQDRRDQDLRPSQSRT